MRVEEGGFGNIQGNSFAIKQSAVAPISVSGLTAPEITQMFSFLPEGSLVSQSGDAHMQAGKILGDIADALVKHVQVLNENWGGDAAQSAVTNFSQLHQTALGLAQASTQTGAVLSWLGAILPAYKSFTAANSSSGDEAARAAMNELNGNLVEANSNLPTTITKNLPTGSAGGSSATTGAVAGGGVAAGAAAAAASPGGGTGGVSPGSPGAPGTPSAPGGAGGTSGVAPGTGPAGTPPGTTLAGLPPSGTGGVPGTGTPGTGVPAVVLPAGAQAGRPDQTRSARFPHQPEQRRAIPVRVAPAERPAVPILSLLVCPVTAPIRFRPAASRAAAIPARRAAFPATGPILAVWAACPATAPIRFRWAAFPVAQAVSVIRSPPVAAAPAARA